MDTNAEETKVKLNTKKYNFKFVGGNAEKNLSKMDSDFLNRFNSMCLEFKKKTNREVIVTRTFTPKTEQEKLYKNSLENKTNEKNNPYPQTLHCYGRAIDIQPIFTNMLEDLGLLEKYGFMAPFSNERRHIQNINEKDKVLSNAGDGLLFKEPIRSRGGESLDSVDAYLKNMFKKGLPTAIIKEIELNRGYSYFNLKFIPSFMGGVDSKYVSMIERYQNYLMDIQEVRNAVKNKKISEEKAVQAIKEMYSLQDGTVLYHDEARHKSKNIFTGKTSTLDYALENREKARNKAISEMIGAIEQLKSRGADLITMIKSVNSIEDAKELEQKAIEIHNEIIGTIENKLGVTYLNVTDEGVWNFKDNITGETFEFSQSGIDKALQTVKSNAFATTLGIAGAVVGALIPLPGTTFLGSMIGTYMGTFIDSYVSGKTLGKNTSLEEANEVSLDAALTDGVINALTFGAGKLIKSFSPMFLNPIISKAKGIKEGVRKIFSKEETINESLKPLLRQETNIAFKTTSKEASDYTKSLFLKQDSKVALKSTTKNGIADTLTATRKKPILGNVKNVYKRFKNIGGKVKKFGGIALKRLIALGAKTMEKRSLLGVGKGNGKRKTTMIPIKNKGKTYYIWAGDFGKDYDKIIKEKNLKEYKLEKDTNFSELKPIEVTMDEVYKKDIVNVEYENKIKREKELQKLLSGETTNKVNDANISESYINELKETGILKNEESIGNVLNGATNLIKNESNVESSTNTIITNKQKPMTKNISANSNNYLSKPIVGNNTNNQGFNIINNNNSSNNFIMSGGEQKPQFSNKIDMKENSKLIKEFNL